MDLSTYETRVYSQNGEDGITIALVDLLYETHTDKYYVEFGVQDGKECNTRILREKCGWSGLQMDGSNESDEINLRQEFITQENVVELFQKYNVPKNIQVLCVDIDYNDFYCLKEILKSYTCDILICEYNATHLPHEDKVVVYEATRIWDGTNYFGGSLLAFTRLANKHGYSLVYCERRGVNSFFIRTDLIEAKGLSFLNQNDVSKIYRRPRYGRGPNGGHAADWENRPYLTSAEICDSI
jgi:hypothetical protein